MPETPTIKDLQQQAITAVRQAENLARRFYGLDLPEAIIDFSLRGRCAGQACVEHNGRTKLRINLQLLADNLDDFLRQTVPHEVAHLVVYWQARKGRTKLPPHGTEWRVVMQNCFGLEPKRCHNYQTTPARVVPRPFLYNCSCRQHHLTSIMHNRISRQSHALCRSCKTPLKFIAVNKT